MHGRDKYCATYSRAISFAIHESEAQLEAAAMCEIKGMEALVGKVEG